MIRFSALVALAAMITAATAPANAQQPQVRTIEVRSSSVDPLGKLLVEAVRGAFGGSSSYRLVLAGGETALVMSTMPLPEGTETDARGIYSLVWFIRDPEGAQTYLNSTVGWTSREAVAQAAAGIVARTDSLLAKAPAPGADRRGSQILGWD